MFLNNFCFQGLLKYPSLKFGYDKKPYRKFLQELMDMQCPSVFRDLFPCRLAAPTHLQGRQVILFFCYGRMLSLSEYRRTSIACLVLLCVLCYALMMKMFFGQKSKYKFSLYTYIERSYPNIKYVSLYITLSMGHSLTGGCFHICMNGLQQTQGSGSRFQRHCGLLCGGKQVGA